MSWFKDLFKKAPEKMTPAATAPLTEFAIDTLMRNLCDVDACLPLLREAGMPEVDFWRVYNLTVIACSMKFLASVLSQSQLPRFYILEKPDGTEEEIVFLMCEVYSKVRAMLSRYGQGDEIVASMSAQVRTMNWCLTQLGASPTAAERASIQMLPPRLPLVGQAASRARIVAGDA
jgi:hypothetical protein